VLAAAATAVSDKARSYLETIMEAQKLVGTRDEIDCSPLLFTHRDVATYQYPFFHGCIENYLPEQAYQSLLENFPKETLHINYSPENTLGRDNPRLKDFWQASPFCKTLVDFFTSETFLKDLRKFIGPAAALQRGYSDHPDWYYVSEWSKAAKSTDAKPIRVTFKFSRLTSGEWIPPHTDNPCKLFSLLIYFAGSNWRESYGGGTEIYEPKFAALKNNWRNIEMPFELMNRRRTFVFLPNRLVFFLKSKNSWHGVSPLACPAGAFRNSLLITFHDRAFQAENSIHTMARNFIRGWMRLKGVSIERSLGHSLSHAN